MYQLVRPRPDPRRYLARPVRGPVGRRLPGRPGAPRVRPGRDPRDGPRRRPAAGRRAPADPGRPHRLPVRGARRGARPRRGRSRSSGSTSSSSSAACGSRAAAADDFRALLAAGLALVVGVQAFIIAAGNLKLIPLTGHHPAVHQLRRIVAARERGRRRPAARALGSRASSRRRRRARGRRLARGRAGRRSARRERRLERHGARTPRRAGGDRPDRDRSATSRSALARRLRGARRRAPATGRCVARQDLSRPPDDAGGHRGRRADAARGRIMDRDGTVLADERKDANGEPYRRLRGRLDQPRHRLRLARLRDGRARAQPTTPS